MGSSLADDEVAAVDLELLFVRAVAELEQPLQQPIYQACR